MTDSNLHSVFSFANKFDAAINKLVEEKIAERERLGITDGLLSDLLVGVTEVDLGDGTKAIIDTGPDGKRTVYPGSKK